MFWSTAFISEDSFFFLISNVYLFLIERESASKGGTEGEGDRIQSRLQALSYQHRAWPGAWTHKQWNHDLIWKTDWATQAPLRILKISEHCTLTAYSNLLLEYFWQEHSSFRWSSCFVVIVRIECSTFFKKFIYLFLRKRERERSERTWVGDGQREGERIPSRLLTVTTEPDAGSNSRTMRSWPELKPRVRHLTSCTTQVPQCCIFKKKTVVYNNFCFLNFLPILLHVKGWAVENMFKWLYLIKDTKEKLF